MTGTKELSKNSLETTESELITYNQNSVLDLLPDTNIEQIKIVTEKEIQNVQEPDFIPPNDLLLAKLTFIMFGVAGVLNWSVLLNCILSIFTVIYEFPSGADTVLLGYFLLSVIAGILRVRARTISIKIVYSGFFLLFFTNILLPLTIHFIDGIIGIIVIHIIASIIGLAVSFLVANGYAYASLIPNNLTGYVMSGNGLAGLAAFLVWQLLTLQFFDIYSKNELKLAVWLLFAFCFLCVLIQTILFSYMTKKVWFQNALKSFEADLGRNSSTANSSTSKKTESGKFIELENQICEKPHNSKCRPLLELLRMGFSSLFLAALNFFITYSLFPSIGPYDWSGASLKESSLLVGIYQLFDFIGRLLPNIYKFLIIPRKYVSLIVMLRILFYPIFILISLYETVLTTKFIIQLFLIIIFALSNGFVGNLAISNVPRCVKTSAEKGILGMIIHLSTQLAIASALIFSELLKFTLQIHYH